MIEKEDVLKLAANDIWSCLGKSGVYFLIKDVSIVYVGQSENIGVRIANHSKAKDFDSFYFMEINRQYNGRERDEMFKRRRMRVEQFFICKFEPILNFGERNISSNWKEWYDFICNGRLDLIKKHLD